jgi:hypothetical protein
VKGKCLRLQRGHARSDAVSHGLADHHCSSMLHVRVQRKPGRWQAGRNAQCSALSPLDNKSAAAFEKHRIRLRMAAGAWRDYHARGGRAPPRTGWAALRQAGAPTLSGPRGLDRGMHKARRSSTGAPLNTSPSPPGRSCTCN